MYGEDMGTNTLARSLRTIAGRLYERLDDGDPWDEIAEDEAMPLMEGAIVMWERIVCGAAEDRQG